MEAKKKYVAKKQTLKRTNANSERTFLLKIHKGTAWGTNSQHILRRLLKVLQAAVKSPQLAQAGAIFSGNTILMELGLYPCLMMWCMYVDLLGMMKVLQSQCYNGQCCFQVLLTCPDDKWIC
jgi:hypothetical protein